MAHYQDAEVHAIEADATESKESADDDAISRGETTDEDEDPKDAAIQTTCEDDEQDGENQD